MNYCYISVIKKNSFSNFKQLELLDLGNNLIETIEEIALSELNKLKYINFSSNFLKDFNINFIGLRESVVVKRKAYQ